VASAKAEIVRNNNGKVVAVSDGHDTYPERVTDSLGGVVAHHRRRFAYAVITAVAVIAAALAGAVVYVVRENDASTRCGFTPPGSEVLGGGYHVDWDWWPPGFMCVYTDESGNVESRRRP
jgi:hypothetical protein